MSTTRPQGAGDEPVSVVFPKTSLARRAGLQLKLLYGLRNPTAWMAVAARGFTETDLDEGWRLLRAASDRALPARRTLAGGGELRALLAVWEDRWVPVIDAALARVFPDVHEDLFAGVDPPTGELAAQHVTTLMERFAAFRHSGNPHHEAALAFLERRGVTAKVLKEADDMVTVLAEVEEELSYGGSDEDAEQAMWTFYVEWSSVAREVIADDALLEQLGLGPSRWTPENEQFDALIPPTERLPHVSSRLS
jgi:hypothetical protein